MIIETMPWGQKIVSAWNETPISSTNLTSIGIAIAQANIRQNFDLHCQIGFNASIKRDRANACNPGTVFDFQWFRTLMALAWFSPRLPSVANALKSFIPEIYVR